MLSDSVRAKLGSLSRRLEEIDRMLAAPETAADMNRFRDLSRERTEIEPVVGMIEAYEGVERDLETAEELLEDPDMRDFALEEIDAARTRLETLEHDLQIRFEKRVRTRRLP